MSIYPEHWNMTSEDREKAIEASSLREKRRNEVYSNVEEYNSENTSPETRARIEKEIRDNETFRKDVLSIFSKMSHMCNRGQEEELIDELMYNLDHEHRTLQQGFVRVLVGVLDAYADSSFDGRNADAVHLARKFRKEFRDKMHLPLI
jgi:hypothetical protein